MSKKLILAITIVAGISALATTAIAAPLPAGTLLRITGTTDPAGLVPCTNGSCFGMFLAPGLFFWTPLNPGIDGGIMVGKGQKSGGQEVNGLLSTDGELTAVWNYGANWGTFFTAPSDAGNVFNDANCTGSGCGSNTTPRLTDLAVWNTAWGGQNIPMGSAAGCNKILLPACTADQVAGIFVKTWTIDADGTTPRNYRMTYNQVAPAGFPNYPFELILSGTVTHGDPLPPVIVATPANLTGFYGVPIPFTIAVTNLYGETTPTCRVGTAPLTGVVALNGCTGGTYTSNIGFIGTDSFTLIVSDVWGGISVDSYPFTVNAGVTHPFVSPTPTHTPTATPRITPSSTIYPTPTNSPTCTWGPHPQPTIVPLYYSTTTGQPVSWDTPATNCGISPPANGTATLTDAATCQGTYTSNSGFVGRDTFGYSYTAYVYESGSHCGYATISGSVNIDVCAANDKRCPSHTPTPTATPPILTECTDRYPLTQATVTGKQGHLTITVTGNLVSVNPNGKEIKICPMTTATYQASTNTPGASVVCRVKSNTARGQGNVKVNDHIKCTDKPIGNDKLGIKIKSGVNQKAM